MKDYFDNASGNSKINNKPPQLRELLNEALFILDRLGVPLDNMTPRRLELVGLCFIVVADVDHPGGWRYMKDLSQGVSMRSRDIIDAINVKVYDRISPGSYDDIRRKYLLPLTLSGIVSQTLPESAVNDSRRGYAISHEYAEVIRKFGTPDWGRIVEAFMSGRKTLASHFRSGPAHRMMQVSLPGGGEAFLTRNEHNHLQMQIVREFLPRYGQDAEVLYIGDAAKKIVVLDSEKLMQLGLFEIGHGNLPDIVAYTASRNWLWLIEAVYTSGPISVERHLILERQTRNCSADIIYVTAFPDKKTFRQYSANIAWETEVWIADSPDHLIHYNGDKFLGPHKRQGAPD